jgi:D-3-phosphoglycerate dehydrogenase
MIFSTHPLHPDVTSRLASKAEFRVASAPTSSAILAEGMDAEVLIVRANIPAEYFVAPNLRAAVRHGAGLDMIPMQAATNAGVLVANVPGVNATTVAEHAVFAAIALRRQFRAMDAALRGQGWNAGRAFGELGRELCGSTLGILGYGNIGRALRDLGNAFGMTVVAHTRRPDTLPADVKPLSIDELMEFSDLLVLCCPLTDETRGVISAERIARMKPGAALINVSRGPVIDTRALIAALEARRISAALDVFDVQPLATNSPLFALENVLLTPHIAGTTEESMLRMGMGAADEALRILNGQLPINFCNPEVEARYRQRFPV